MKCRELLWRRCWILSWCALGMSTPYAGPPPLSFAMHETATRWTNQGLVSLKTSLASHRSSKSRIRHTRILYGGPVLLGATDRSRQGQSCNRHQPYSNFPCELTQEPSNLAVTLENSRVRLRKAKSDSNQYFVGYSRAWLPDTGVTFRLFIPCRLVKAGNMSVHLMPGVSLCPPYVLNTSLYNAITQPL